MYNLSYDITQKGICLVFWNLCSASIDITIIPLLSQSGKDRTIGTEKVSEIGDRDGDKRD